jgi:hypothetical protein
MVALTLPHEHLPPPLREVASWILLAHVKYADYYLLVGIVALLVLAFIQLKAFARPPPVPSKRLPKRPILSILFHPDDITSSHIVLARKQASSGAPVMSSSGHDNFSGPWRSRLGKQLSSVASVTDSRQVIQDTLTDKKTDETTESVVGTDDDIGLTIDDLDDELDDEFLEGPILHHDDEPLAQEQPATFTISDLPDSFAPLLSSSHVETNTSQLTADLIHAVKFEAHVRMGAGRHEIPLDKDRSRPQLVMDVPKQGIKISAVGMVGSDGFSTLQDLDASQKTTSRSTPMVKNAGLVFDPPLPLSNVAPTLIHFPTLFEDNSVPTLRRIQIIRFFIDFVISISSFLEKCLWILESKCQIHLSKVRIVPSYKGHSKEGLKSPEWRLSLSFSGHVLLFGIVPIPFINVTLPTFVIPQPHALLEYLLTAQPLASAKIRRELIAENRIALALLGTAESWSANVKVIVTPPAVGVDVTLPGGLAVAVELGLGRDPHAGQSRGDLDPFVTAQKEHPSDASMSSWTTKQENSGSFNQFRSNPNGGGLTTSPYDANEIIPWSIEILTKGTISHEKVSVHLLKCSAKHKDSLNGVPVVSKFSARGSLVICKLPPGSRSRTDMSPIPINRKASFASRKSSFGILSLEEEYSPSVAAVLLFPGDTETFRSEERMLKYDYNFDVSEDTKIDAITVSIGASHIMLNGGTMVTTILDNLYAYGSFAAREDAVLDPIERKRKRNILCHLPAADFTAGVHNIFIPQESNSFSDDGLTLFVPYVDGGRLKIRLIGGIEDELNSVGGSVTSGFNPSPEEVYEGIKVIADFEVPSLVLNSEGSVGEFPELEIFEGSKLRTHLSGVVWGSIRAHLRPQQIGAVITTTGPNIFNPLEAYEIDCSGSNLSMKIKEYTATLGHRRIIFPAESTVGIQVVESVVDMGFEGKTQCELTWDFQGLSPILQVTPPGTSPVNADPEHKEQASLLIGALRQGRLSFRVSPVGGIAVQKAATSREDKEGLYDWKFFNALVSPDDESASRIIDILHDRRTMTRFLQCAKLVSEDLHKILRDVLEQVWKAKEIFDDEGICEPKDIIPTHKLARIIARVVAKDLDQAMKIMPTVESVVRGVVNGDGLDILKVKEFLHECLEKYDKWAPELDRIIRWAALMVGPMPAGQPYVENNVIPLSIRYTSRFQDIPSASELYEKLLDKPQLPLDPAFSNLVSSCAPYLSFRQIEFFLEVRAPSDWQPSDLRRLRYVYTIKRKVLEIAESYGGLSFLPQSFLVSVFLGEATRTSLRASLQKRKRMREKRRSQSKMTARSLMKAGRRMPTLTNLRRRRPMKEGRLKQVPEYGGPGFTPAERAAALREVDFNSFEEVPENLILEMGQQELVHDAYELGDSLLGPQDVAILLQAGLTSVMKASTVVQLNQRMILDLICSQPRSFAVAVLAEIGSPSGSGSQRGLTSALMALLELDQTAFKPSHRIDMHSLLEAWLPGVKMPRREHYMAGGRWARQSYYEAIFAIATSILEDAEIYAALKGHVQRVRNHNEDDPVPVPRGNPDENENVDSSVPEEGSGSRLKQLIADAKNKIHDADSVGMTVYDMLQKNEKRAKETTDYKSAVRLYEEAFEACRMVLALDKHAFYAGWFREFYRRNYDALIIKSMFDNVIADVDNVRYWLHVLRTGAKSNSETKKGDIMDQILPRLSLELDFWSPSPEYLPENDELFLKPEKSTEQRLITAIIDATIYEPHDRVRLKTDPLVRLLISNPPGDYNFTIVSAMGVVTDGKRGTELGEAFKRLENQRGVKVVRADTATARSLEYNAAKIEEAIDEAVQMNKPYGYMGYSQGCANALLAETMLLSGSPKQQQALKSSQSGLVCRQLLFSAANGSFHGIAMEKKIERLIVQCEEFFKYQQGYFSRAFSSFILESLNSALDSSSFHKIMAGAQCFLPEGCRTFWREAQHLSHVPTCTLRGVMEEHTTPECLEMLCNLLTKDGGSPLHDSQVHVFDAVGYPVYYKNRNGRVLEKCAIGDSAIERTHHWSPLSAEVQFLRTTKDVMISSFDCAKDRHVFPWVDVNARFGFISYTKTDKGSDQLSKLKMDAHLSKLLDDSPAKESTETLKK